MNIGKLEPVDLREMFLNEALNFTPWLQDNIDVLSERLGIELSVVEREKQVGSFSLDLLAEGPGGEMVIIENQLYRTDHDHLGKILTYLVNLDAKTAIWVTPEVRPEHMRVFQWLNENTPEDVQFYLIKVEAFKIGGSDPAPLFTVMAAPSETGKAGGGAKKELAARHVKRKKFWEQLLKRSKGKTHLFENISPSIDNWISTGAGRTGFYFCYIIYMDKACVGVEIDFDSGTGEANKAVFDTLHGERERIEAEFGEPLEWDRKDKVRYSCIRKTFPEAGLRDEDEWDSIQERMTDAMIRLDKVFRPRIAKLKL